MLSGFGFWLHGQILVYLGTAAIPYDKRVIPDYVIIRPLEHVELGEVTRYLSFDR